MFVPKKVVEHGAFHRQRRGQQVVQMEDGLEQEEETQLRANADSADHVELYQPPQQSRPRVGGAQKAHPWFA